MKQSKYDAIGWRTVNAGLILQLLEDIKKLWDVAGLGDDDEVSEPIYRRLEATITGLSDIGRL